MPEASLCTHEKASARRRLSLSACEMGTRVQLSGSWLPAPVRWLTCTSPRYLFSQSEGPRPRAPLSGGPRSRWRRTRWRVVATRPLGLTSRRSPLRAAWVWAPRKPCPPTAATPRPPQGQQRPMTPAWGKVRIAVAALWYGAVQAGVGGGRDPEQLYLAAKGKQPARLAYN